MAERFDPTKSTLINQAIENQSAADAKAREEAEAAEKIPELKKRFDDFVLKLFPQPRPPRRTRQVPGQVTARKAREIVERASASLREPHGMFVECKIPVPDSDPTIVTIRRGTSYYDSFDKDQDIIIDVKALPEVFVFGSRGGAKIESKAHNRADYGVMNTPVGANLDRGPVTSRKPNLSDISDYSDLIDILKHRNVEKTPSRFHQQRPY